MELPSVQDRRMWRKLLAKVHPDAGGEHELFIWADQVREHCAESPAKTQKKTYSPPRSHNPVREFMDGLQVVYQRPFDVLANKWMTSGNLGASTEEATKPQVAKIAHLCGMSDKHRYGFYGVCEEFGLTKQQASWVIEELTR